MDFFGTKNVAVSTDALAQWLVDAVVDAEIESDEEEGSGTWAQIALYLENGEPVAEIDRYVRGDEDFDEYIADVVRELLDDKEPVMPNSAVRWLCQYMQNVQVIYSFKPHQALYDEKGWAIFNQVWTNLKKLEPGIVHNIGEGFTNEDGSQITWEFPPGATGSWKMAVLDSENQWTEFDVNLENDEQRMAFLAGKLPADHAASK
jgi:hypothetical protein